MLNHITFEKNTTMHVLIFKTNIKLKQDLKKLQNFFSKYPFIIRWNVDRTDIDKVLRVEAVHQNTAEIMHIVHNAGFFCEELAD